MPYLCRPCPSDFGHTWRHLQNWKYVIYPNHAREGMSLGTGNVHHSLMNFWLFGFWDIPADRQTRKHAHRSTPNGRREMSREGTDHSAEKTLFLPLVWNSLGCETYIGLPWTRVAAVKRGRVRRHHCRLHFSATPLTDVITLPGSSWTLLDRSSMSRGNSESVISHTADVADPVLAQPWTH